MKDKISLRDLSVEVDLNPINVGNLKLSTEEINVIAQERQLHQGWVMILYIDLFNYFLDKDYSYTDCWKASHLSLLYILDKAKESGKSFSDEMQDYIGYCEKTFTF